MTPAIVADRREGLQQPFPYAFTGHLDKTKVGDVKHLSSGLVASKGIAQGAGHVLAVRLDLHVDKVDDDDSANVAEPELSSDFLGGLKGSRAPPVRLGRRARRDPRVPRASGACRVRTSCSIATRIWTAAPTGSR